MTRGIKTVLLRGSELYRAEAKVQETLAKYGHNTPDDWIERNLYTRYSWQGVGLMVIINVLLFGAIGLTVWAVQMMWIPITAAGIINGIGHWWGYRNFEATDASTNVSPWGINHRRRRAAQQPSHLPDLGQAVGSSPTNSTSAGSTVRAMEMVGLARSARRRRCSSSASVRPVADDKDARGHHRQPLRSDGQVRTRHARCLCAELQHLKEEGAAGSAKLANMRLAQRWLHRDAEKIPQSVKAQVDSAVALSPRLTKLVAMREELRQLWTRTNVSAEQLVADLQVWCKTGPKTAGLQRCRIRAEAAGGPGLTSTPPPTTKARDCGPSSLPVGVCAPCRSTPAPAAAMKKGLQSLQPSRLAGEPAPGTFPSLTSAWFPCI